MSKNTQKITKGEVFEFVKKELVPVNTQRVECADGRYFPEESQGAIRAFGGDFGIVLAFAAALKTEGTYLTSDEIVERYYRAVRKFRGENAQIYYHSDEEHHAKGEIGCGHAKHALDPKNNGKYGVSSSEAGELYEEFDKHQKSNLTVLEGDHKEKGVLQVEGTSHSMNSRNNSSEFFVITPEMIDFHIDLVTPIFSKGLQAPVNPEDVKAFYIKQQNVTAEILGADKIPWYRVQTGPFRLEQLRKKRRAN